MRTLSVDLRERILSSYDHEEGTREEIASRYRVSLGMVKKLLHQRRHTGDIRPRHYRSGRKPKILPGHRQELRTRLSRKPDMTLKELRQALALNCTLPAIHYVLQKMGLTYKKRHSGPASRTGPTSSGRGGAGAGSKGAWIRPG
jgi:transposase